MQIMQLASNSDRTPREQLQCHGHRMQIIICHETHPQEISRKLLASAKPQATPLPKKQAPTQSPEVKSFYFSSREPKRKRKSSLQICDPRCPQAIRFPCTWGTPSSSNGQKDAGAMSKAKTLLLILEITSRLRLQDHSAGSGQPRAENHRPQPATIPATTRTTFRSTDSDERCGFWCKVHTAF
jgi:hypothetical protein